MLHVLRRGIHLWLWCTAGAHVPRDTAAPLDADCILGVSNIDAKPLLMGEGDPAFTTTAGWPFDHAYAVRIDEIRPRWKCYRTDTRKCSNANAEIISRAAE